MHVGMSVFFQNLTPGLSDDEVYRNELAIADMAEPLGFESIWAAEHHFSGYTMCPNVNQFLTYMAGRTRHLKLGSMVTVLPWHDPVRVAEEITVLDHVSQGRVIFGMGRGLGAIEFRGLRVEMGESRERFVEYAGAILNALETGKMEADGTFYKQPAVEIRPRPFKSFKGRSYAAAVSPESARIVAGLGLGVLVIAQKPWDKTIAELDAYRDLYRELNGVDAPGPIAATFVACHEDESVAKEMWEKYICGYSASALNHYEFDNTALANIKGYEYYGGLAKNIQKHGREKFVEFLAELQVYGTPDQVFEKIVAQQEMMGAAGSLCSFSYGGMPYDMGRRNMLLFAEKVLPRLKAHQTRAAVRRAAA
jgi:alkanesulfonate monooxygenase SsuD/methylene tetrahydromethanopterin reductase-like flavin-dependent oxidoreductase (luciferase family)